MVEKLWVGNCPVSALECLALGVTVGLHIAPLHALLLLIKCCVLVVVFFTSLTLTQAVDKLPKLPGQDSIF